jgi:hypothetical protein
MTVPAASLNGRCNKGKPACSFLASGDSMLRVRLEALDAPRAAAGLLGAMVGGVTLRVFRKDSLLI